jgi:para-nitrobenzyl esterase
MKKVLYCFVALVLLVMAGVGTLINYLAPETESERMVDQSTVRQLDSGEVIGFTRNDVSTWLGIPYAASPVGELRWKAPRPAKRWQNQKQALHFGEPCMQRSSGHEVIGNEDCLFINIWSPSGADGKSPQGLPVMFWIHGGGNSTGQAGISLYDGSYISQKHNLVIVSINYRVGPFGWFYHSALQAEGVSPEDASGNFGTLDIIQALKWVNRNIAQFGGNPNNVTVYGESAGGFNTLSMMASPLAKGLFHRAISQSGGLDIHSVERAENYKDAAEPGHKFSSKEVVNLALIQRGLAADREAAKRHQDGMNADELEKFMRSLNAKEIIDLYSSTEGSMLGSPALFGDGYVLPAGRNGAEMFTDADNYNAVPIILGSNRDETKTMMAFSDDSVDRTFGYPTGFNNLPRYNRKSYYSSALWKIFGVDDLANTMTAAQGHNVYAYRFDVDDLRDLGFLDFRDLFGAAHALEIPFVFGNFSKFLRVLLPDSMQSEFDKVSDQMMSYWAEFAYSGSPGKGRASELADWKPWSKEHPSALRLMVFDTESDAGTRMVSDQLSIEDLQRRLLADTTFKSEAVYCAVYNRLFTGADYFAPENLKAAQYDCSQYPPNEGWVLID